MSYAQLHTHFDDIATLLEEDETPALSIWPHGGRVTTIPRPRLVAQLASERARSLVVIRAPAGYGKSTFAEQWCRSDDRPVAWLSLRESDNDAVQLLSRLTTALEGLESVDPELVDDLTTPGATPVGVLFSRFLDDLALRTPFLLALDDAHVIDRPSAVMMLKGLANAIPAGSQLVLVSRTDTPIGLARMRAAGKLCEVGPEDLALDRAETRRLFSSGRCRPHRRGDDRAPRCQRGVARGPRPGRRRPARDSVGGARSRRGRWGIETSPTTSARRFSTSSLMASGSSCSRRRWWTGSPAPCATPSPVGMTAA